jgi:RNA polymerase sigma-70 factor, ECF subfamily
LASYAVIYGVHSSPELESEEALVLAAQSDPSRFTELYRHHVAAVHALAWSRLGDRAGAEDVTAETFRRALRGLPRYEPRGVPFRAWLWRICINLINDELNRRQRASRFTMALPEEPPERIAADEIAQVETRALVHGLVDRLAVEQRTVITLRFGEDLPIAAVARRLGRSPDAVKQLQRRALAELRALVAEGDHDA